MQAISKQGKCMLLDIDTMRCCNSGEHVVKSGKELHGKGANDSESFSDFFFGKGSFFVGCQK